jgi:hypothetical protein
MRVNQSFGGTCCLHFQGRRMNRTKITHEECYTETSFHFQRITLRCSPEDITLHNYSRENPNCNIKPIYHSFTKILTYYFRKTVERQLSYKNREENFNILAETVN